MQSKYTWLTLIVIVGIGLIAGLKFIPTPPTGVPVTLLGITVPPVPTSNPKWAAQGEILYSQYCASVMGSNWRVYLIGSEFKRTALFYLLPTTAVGTPGITLTLF